MGRDVRDMFKVCLLKSQMCLLCVLCVYINVWLSLMLKCIWFAVQDLLSDAGVGADWTWDQALRAIVSDERFVMA